MKLTSIIIAALLMVGSAAMPLSGARGQSLTSELNGRLCAGTLSSDVGPGGAAAIFFSDDGRGGLIARLYFTHGQAAKDTMLQAIASRSASPEKLSYLGIASNLAVSGNTVSFDRTGPDNSGTLVVLRHFRLVYAGGVLQGDSQPVLSRGQSPNTLSLVCNAAQ